MPIVFSDADVASGLFYWTTIDDVRVDYEVRQTACWHSNLCELLLRNGNRQLSGDYRRRHRLRRGAARANQLPWEVESLVEAGLEPWEALASVTWRGGDLLGEPGAGVITEGGPADFSLVHGDPLTEATALWRVWRVAW